MYNVYKDGEKVMTTDKRTAVVGGLGSGETYTIGVSQVIDGRESEVVTIEAQTEQDVQVVELTVPEIKALLDERGIEYPSSARKAELIALLGE